MRIWYSVPAVQLVLLTVIFASAFSGCERSRNELPLMPPETHPLARDYIGYGVVSASFTHVLSEPGSSGVSQGYLRRGTVTRIIERRQLNNRGNFELWILVEGNYREGSGGVSRGWIEEHTLGIYDSEDRANTASKTMIQ